MGKTYVIRIYLIIIYLIFSKKNSAKDPILKHVKISSIPKKNWNYCTGYIFYLIKIKSYCFIIINLK